KHDWVFWYRDLDQYLPQELQSAAFRVSREGLGEQDSPQLRLNRFHSLPAHSDRWDMVLFTGGPVWALEWCPTPDGAPARQYVAVACHAGMDDLHLVTQTPSGPGLVQLWDCGELEYNSRPDSPPALVYGLAQDRGFIWGLKWCPSGAWEPPASSRKAPHLPRLGLLAVASSSAVVSIYSLPHPDALLCSDGLNTSGEPSQSPGGSNPAVNRSSCTCSLPAEGSAGSEEVQVLTALESKHHISFCFQFCRMNKC
ncbi:general transcription factor 3C polypeptide 2, partial [Oryzias melastigma]|uniref:general transcription factor 3C polypeptide 2 n=1 Tax=Oryzias melastigma TaxID=30732 RepID=UPI00168D4685